VSEAAAQDLRRPVRLAFCTALAAYLACAAWLVWRTSVLEPYSDMYDWMARWYRLQADGDVARYLWAPHNLHHLVWTFGVLDLDLRLFGARGYLFVAVGVACLATTAALMAWLAAHAAVDGGRLVGAGVAAALSLMGCHVLDVNAEIETTYVHALLFAAAAIVLAAAPGKRPGLRWAAALGCAAAAGLGSGAGLAVWPALLLIAWRSGWRGWTAIVLLAGVAYAAVYALGESPGSSGLHRPDMATASALALNFLALPWVRAWPAIGEPLGLVVVAAALAALAFKGRRGAPWPERAAIGLIVFSLAAAAMTGLGRNGLIAPDMMPMRYAVFLIPLHVGLWVLALPYLRVAWMRWPRGVAAGVAAAAALMLVHQAVMAVFAIRTGDANLRVVADFRAGRETPVMTTAIYPDLATARTLAQAMRRDGYYQGELRTDPPASP
jgi:hypothetical protein